MKITITILLSLICWLGFAQSSEKIMLEWKIAKNDTLKYKTTMNAVSIADEETKQKNTGSILSENDLNEVFKSLADINSNLKYQTDLFLNNKNEKHIDIEMRRINEDSKNSNEDIKKLVSKLETENKKEGKKKKKSNNSKEEADPIDIDLTNMFNEAMGMNNNVVLRGRISNTGEIISNYYKNSQKNLIAVLFELPNREVKIGEKWKMSTNLIEMDQNFVCDSSSGENYAYIERIIESNNEKIAVIKYNIVESVAGNFNNPMGKAFGMETNQKINMKVSHKATGNFSITKGKWISYEGEMEIENGSSLFGGKSKTEFKLIE